MELLCKSWALEIRPNLQSVNAFVIFDEDLPELPKITVGSTYIEITHENRTLKLEDPSGTLAATTVSGVYLKNNHLAFRITTNSTSVFGGSKCEILMDALSPKTQISKTFLKPETRYDLHCNNCLQILARDRKYDRVLPLPSESAQPDDWFCHGHGQAKFSLSPSELDIFYSTSFTHVNRSNFDCAKIVAHDSDVICKTCLSCLGSVLDAEGLKIWNHTVSFVSNCETFTSRALNDVFEMLDQLLSKNSLVRSHKFLLRHNSDYLSLWILESRLQLCLKVDNNVAETFTVAKVLFKFASSEAWMSDSFVSLVSVSKPMMTELLRHLYEMNKFVPVDFAQTNGFYVSYMKMYNRIS